MRTRADGVHTRDDGVHTRVEVVARPGPGGRTVLPVLRSCGALAVRQTGPATVHLVGTVAGPLGGDEVEVTVHVAAGARLALRSVAAAVVLPGRAQPGSSSALRAVVDDGGVLDLDLEPTVVVGDARHEVRTTLDVHGGAALRFRERVQLGRWQEQAGAWRGTCHATVDGRPLLRQTVALGPGSPAWDRLAAPRALVSGLVVDPSGGPSRARTHGAGVLLPLSAGGYLVAATGRDLADATLDAEAVTRGY